MAVELPGEVVQLLAFIGVNWPNINEDKVREAASHIREFAQNVQSTHESATATLRSAGQHYQGAAYEAMISMWGQKSQDHMHELVDACNVVATALDVGADAIVGMKMAAVAELIGLAASFVADQAASVVTFGLAEAALPVIEETAQKCVEFLEQQLIQYVIGQIVEAAIKPLIGVVDRAMDGLVYKTLSSALGVSTSGGAVGASFQMDPDAFKATAQVMQQHAATMAAHGQALQSALTGMSFA